MHICATGCVLGIHASNKCHEPVLLTPLAVQNPRAEVFLEYTRYATRLHVFEESRGPMCLSQLEI